jgi:hypothetical protein
MTMKIRVKAKTSAKRDSGAAGRLDVSEVQSARRAPAAEGGMLEMGCPLMPEI